MKSEWRFDNEKRLCWSQKCQKWLESYRLSSFKKILISREAGLGNSFSSSYITHRFLRFTSRIGNRNKLRRIKSRSKEKLTTRINNKSINDQRASNATTTACHTRRQTALWLWVFRRRRWQRRRGRRTGGWGGGGRGRWRRRIRGNIAQILVGWVLILGRCSANSSSSSSTSRSSSGIVCLYKQVRRGHFGRAFRNFWRARCC